MITDNPSNTWVSNLEGRGHSGTWAPAGEDPPTWTWEETEPDITLNGLIIWYEGTYYFYVEDSNSYGFLS